MSLRTSLLGAAVIAIGTVAHDGISAPTVKIKYGQIVNFYQMDNHDPSQTGPVNSFTAGDGMFIMYRIKKIENDTSSSFQFHSGKVISMGPSGDSDADMPNLYPFVGHLGSVAVAGGATLNLPGCVVKWVRADQPQVLNHTSALVDLDYPGATIFRALTDTATLVLPQQTAWPELLAKLCTP